MRSVAEKKPAPEFVSELRDPRLADLRAMGMQRFWVEIAEQIGVDAFMLLWKRLDAEPAAWYDGGTLRVPIRSWKTFLRYQRNRYIRQLRDSGMTPHQVRQQLSQQLGESLSILHIKRLFAER